MRLVLDTNVIASATLWGGNPLLLLQARRENRVELYTSMPLLAELTDILSRRKFEKKIVASLLTVDQLVDRYTELAQVVRPLAIPRIAPDEQKPFIALNRELSARWPAIIERKSAPPDADEWAKKKEKKHLLEK